MPSPRRKPGDRKCVTVPFKLSKAIDDTDPSYFQFEGYASTFGNTDWYGDTVQPGAFKQSLAEKMPKLCYQHDMGQPVGVIDEAREDKQGLFIKGRMPKSMQLCQDIMALVTCGAIDSFSIGFNTMDSEYKEDGGRVLIQIDLWEVSFVTVPADAHATITDAKSVDEVKAEIKTKRDFERVLRESGVFSVAASKYLATLFKAPQRDAEDDLEDLTPEVKSGISQLNADLQQLLRSAKNAGSGTN